MTVESLELKTQHSKLSTVLFPWRAAWTHALAAHYRNRVAPRRFPRLDAAAVLLVWGLFLGGTALGVTVYPQATDVTCDWYTCHYPLTNGTLPLERLFYFLGQTIFGQSFCTLLILAFVGLSIVSWVRRLRGTRKPRPLTLAGGWNNGVAALLAITPLGPEGLVRVRFLARLYALWRRRATIAVIVGAAAAVVVSWHVLWPIFWWLGPWGQWGAQVMLAMLWGATAVVWLVGLAAHALLQEVTFTDQPSFFGTDWRILPTLTLSGAILSPLILSRVYFSLRGPLSYHDTNTLGAVTAPLILIVVGAGLAALNYALAQVVFRVRVSHTATPG